MLTALFTNDEASDPGYVNIRDAKDGILKSARGHCEYLWILFQHHADNEFRIELRRDFDARYWEMYLTASLIFSGYLVTCPEPGPDVGIIHKGQRIWFEAVSPKRGAPEKPDSVPGMRLGELGDVPEDKIMLRCLNSIKDKYERQYASWLKNGIISREDAFVVAVNTQDLGFHNPDADPPHILRAAYAVGPAYAVVDPQTFKIVRTGYQFRNSIPKAGGKTAVASGVFQRRDYDYTGLSALLFSHVDAANRPGEMGGDFQLAPNPHARVPLPQGLRLRGTRYEGKMVEDGYDMTRAVSRIL